MEAAGEVEFEPLCLRTGRFPGVLAGGYCLSEGAVGAGESATERFSLNGRVGASPAASGPWQHTQALALQQAQRRGVLQRRQPNSVHLGQQLRIILLHSLQALKHGGHMGLTQQEGITVVVFPRVSKVPEQRSELGGEHVNLQAVEEPALGLVALASTLHPGAQHGLQVTELFNV